MAFTGICPEDGFPTELTRYLGGGSTTRCLNPWHPHTPGQCPHCGSRRPPGRYHGTGGWCRDCYAARKPLEE